MKKACLLLLLLIFNLTTSYAQQLVTDSLLSIYGSVKDEEGLPVPMAHVVLLSIPDSLEIDDAWGDTTGQYRFDAVRSGTYTIVVMQIGYEKFQSTVLHKHDTAAIRNNPIVKPEGKGIEVTVKGKKPIVRQEEGKMIVSVENMLTVSGLSAFEVLKRSPGVTADNNGSILLKGKSGVLVMLDDKPLYMTGEQVSNLLKAIPADQIKEVELITSPSAKYDAAGTAGIINIKLKKGAYDGFNGTVTASYGQGFYHKANIGFIGSYNKKKWSTHLGYQYNNKVNLFEQQASRSYSDSNSAFSRISSSVHYRTPHQAHAFNAGATYDITEKIKVTLNLMGNYADYEWKAINSTDLQNRNSNALNTSYASDKGLYSETNYNIHAEMEKTLDTNGSSISAGFHYIRYTGVSNKNYEVIHRDSLGQILPTSFLFVFRDPSYNNQYTGKLDYTGKIRKKITMESGVKLVASDRNNPAMITIHQSGTSSDQSNPFVYKESIYSSYLILKRTVSKKWLVNLGVRLEHTAIEGQQTRLDTSFSRNYTNLFPTANLTFNASDKTSYSFSFSRRIDRPQSWHLNPVQTFIDPYSSWGGNPYLLPSYTNNFEWCQSLFGGALVTTFNYSNTKQSFAWAVLLDSTSLKTITQPRNMTSYENTGLSVALNLPLTKWWTTSVYAYGYLNHFTGDLGYGTQSNQQLSADFNTTQTFVLSKKTNAELSGSYETPWAYGLNRVASRGQLNLAVQRNLWAGKASVKIAVSDLFWTDRWRPSNSFQSVVAKSTQYEDTRVIMLTFNYKLGGVVHRL